MYAFTWLIYVENNLDIQITFLIGKRIGEYYCLAKGGIAKHHHQQQQQQKTGLEKWRQPLRNWIRVQILRFSARLGVQLKRVGHQKHAQWVENFNAIFDKNTSYHIHFKIYERNMHVF